MKELDTMAIVPAGSNPIGVVLTSNALLDTMTPKFIIQPYG